MRRLYNAAKDASGRPLSDKKGNAYRAVEQLTTGDRKVTALASLREQAREQDEIVEHRGITYIYRQRCASTFPTREEFLVALPAALDTKARSGLDWFEGKGDAPQQSA